MGAARPPQLLLLLLQRDISFALSPSGKNIPDMQLSSQLTLAGSDPAEGHLPSPAAISTASKATPASGARADALGGPGVHAHTSPHKPSRRHHWFHTSAPSRLLPLTKSTQPAEQAGPALPQLPPPLPSLSWCRQIPPHRARWRRSRG